MKRNLVVFILTYVCVSSVWAGDGLFTMTDRVATDDTWTNPSSPTYTGYGTAGPLYSSMGFEVFMQFDLTHATGDSIVKTTLADLELYLHSNHSETGIEYRLYRLTEAFDESMACYNDRPAYDDTAWVDFATTQEDVHHTITVDVSDLFANNGNMQTFGLRMVCTDDQGVGTLAQFSTESGWPCYGKNPSLTANYRTAWPKIFDFRVMPECAWGGASYLDSNGFHTTYENITPVPRPGYWYNSTDSRYATAYSAIAADNRPVSLFAAEGGGQDINDISYALDNVVPRLDYVFMDYEPPGDASTNTKVNAICDLVHDHTNSDIKFAKIGNYDYFPAPVNTWGEWSKINNDRSSATNWYKSSELEVAMPSCYPYESYCNHTNAFYWGTNVAPNVRSALFWAPLEKFSATARVMRDSSDTYYDQSCASHDLIPWVNNFVPYNEGFVNDIWYHADAPSKIDNYELLRHMRLRGADGFYMFNTLDDPDDPDYHYDMDEYRGDMLEAWASLDFLFDNDATVTFLNFSTDKTGGVQWSAAINDNNEFAFLVSNLTGSWVEVDESELPQTLRSLFGYNSVYVSPWGHAFFYEHAPEPSSLILLLAGMGVMIRKRKRHIP